MYRDTQSAGPGADFYPQETDSREPTLLRSWFPDPESWGESGWQQIAGLLPAPVGLCLELDATSGMICNQPAGHNPGTPHVCAGQARVYAVW